jgi:NADH-quinone oxidoreductase subunit K
MHFYVYQIVHYSFTLFTLALLGVLHTPHASNIIKILMYIEVMLLSANMNLLIFSIIFNDIIGQSFMLFIIAVAAAESAIGLAMVILYHRVYGSISIAFLNLMKG